MKPERNDSISQSSPAEPGVSPLRTAETMPLGLKSLPPNQLPSSPSFTSISRLSAMGTVPSDITHMLNFQPAAPNNIEQQNRQLVTFSLVFIQ